MFKPKTYFLIPFLGLGCFGLSGQTDATKNSPNQMLWLAYYNKLQLKEKWIVSSDIQFRTTEWIQKPAQALARTTLLFKPSDEIYFGGGLAYFQFFENYKTSRSEWRPFQEIYLRAKFNKLKLNNRVRVEERFTAPSNDLRIVSAYKFNWRFRYQLEFEFLISKKENKQLSVTAGNEIMLNASSKAIKAFDQNRVYTGANFALNKNITLQLQFMHILQSQTTSNTITKINSIRINFYHNI